MSEGGGGEEDCCGKFNAIEAPESGWPRRSEVYREWKMVGWDFYIPLFTGYFLLVDVYTSRGVNEGRQGAYRNPIARQTIPKMTNTLYTTGDCPTNELPKKQPAFPGSSISQTTTYRHTLDDANGMTHVRTFSSLPYLMPCHRHVTV